MTTNAVTATIILVCIIISFILNKIPIGLTALLGTLAMAFFGVTSFSDALSKFGSDTVMMVIGVSVIGNTLFETGCAQLLGKALVSIKGVGHNEKVFLVVVLIVVSILSAFVSNTATVAMMIPLIASVAAASGRAITKKNTYMAVGIASIVGGNITMCGSTPQIVAQGILEQSEACRTLYFFELAKGAIPIVIVMVVFFVTIGYRLQKRVLDFPDVSDGVVEGQSREAASPRKIIISIAVFIGCIIGFTSGVATFGVIAIVGACVCCLTGCITPERIWETMDWRTIVVLGGSLGFASGMEKSGALQFIAECALAKIGDGHTSVWLVSATIIIVCSVLANVMSHTATAAIMTPVAISLAQGMHLDPIPFVIMVIIGCSLAFATPMSTPPLTMVMVGGYRFTDYIKIGGAFNVVAVAVAIITLPVLYGLV